MYMYICICIYVYVYMYMYICICICIYVYVYVYVYELMISQVSDIRYIMNESPLVDIIMSNQDHSYDQYAINDSIG